MTPVQQILQFIGNKELSPLADYIRKEILPLEEKMLGEAFEAGVSYHHFSDGPGPYAPDKEQYLENIKL